MDSLTHLVAGGLTPLLFKRAPRRTALVWFGILAGELPDIDFFFARGTPEGLMAVHRGLTHSLFFQPFLSLALVIPFFIVITCHLRRLDVLLSPVGTSPIFPPFPTPAPMAATGSPSALPSTPHAPIHLLGLMFGMALLAQYVHIFLDCVTTFGTQLLLPFSSFRMALPGMFIIDFFLLVPITLLWIAALRLTPATALYWSAKSRLLARLALGWLILYPLSNLAIHAILTSHYAQERGVPYEQVTVLTEPFTPFAWKKVVWEGETCTMETVFPLKELLSRTRLSSSPTEGGAPEKVGYPTAEPGMRIVPVANPVTAIYAVPDAALMEWFGREIPLFALYQEFAPTLVLVDKVEDTVNMHLQQRVYTFADVRYLISPQSPARWLGVTTASFAFEVKTSHGRVAAYRYLDNLKDKNVPWIRL